MVGSGATYLHGGDLIALLDRADPGHSQAVTALRVEMQIESLFMTSDFDVVKASLELQRRHALDGPRRLVNAVLPYVHVEWCTPRDYASAVAIQLAADVAAANDLVDCVADQIIRRSGAQEFFTRE